MPQQPARERGRFALWLCLSALAHGLVLLGVRARDVEDDPPPFHVPALVEFGIAEAPGGRGQQETHSAQPPSPPPVKKPRAPHKPRRKPDPQAFGPATAAQEAQSQPAGRAADSGEGVSGQGSGSGLGDGSGYAPLGATIALNVDLERVRTSALVLETRALFHIIPGWQPILAGSGLDPLKDFQRVFVATPDLDRASLVIAARYQLPRARIETAVSQLAAVSGGRAAFATQRGLPVAPWLAGDATPREIALSGPDQFTIARASDMARVLEVASALGHVRKQQGFADEELAAMGGLLAMQEDEAVALWIEGVGKYVRQDSPATPKSLRLSISPVDQFNVELRVRAEYGTAEAAAAARGALDALRAALSDNERVIFLGLKSALDQAQLEPVGSALQLRVRLTLHQTRYLLHYVARALRPPSSR